MYSLHLCIYLEFSLIINETEMIFTFITNMSNIINDDRKNIDAALYFGQFSSAEFKQKALLRSVYTVF